VRFTKSRGFWGADAEPFEARFVDGAWSTSEIVADDSDAALAALRADGLSIRQIAERSGRSKSAVDRRLKGARRERRSGPRLAAPGAVPRDSP
jgi:DNA-directed RNA polymerase specialized sigma24 family protein